MKIKKIDGIKRLKLSNVDLQLKKRADLVHKKVHRSGLVHTRKHISAKLDSVKNLDTRRLLASWTSKFIIIVVLSIFSFAKLKDSEKYPGLINGGSVIVGMADESSSLRLNPLTLSSPTELAVGRLVFSSPLKYDSLGKLKGDAAESFEIAEGGKRIRLVLRPNIKWHDGRVMTSEDIIFTIAKLKEPKVSSSLRDSLVGVEVVAIDSRTVDITTQNPVAALDDLMTRVRIAPKHLFDGVSDSDIASVDYNQLPIGSGPLEIGSFVSTKDTATLGIEGAGKFQQIKLNPSKNYYGNSAQTELTLRIFADKDNLEQAFSSGIVEVYVASGGAGSIRDGSEEIRLALSSGVFSFFNMQSPNLSNAKLRKALAGYLDRPLVSELSGGVGALYSPILGVDQAKREMITTEAAKQLITEGGWQLDAARNVFVRDGQDLELSLVTGDSDDYSAAADTLAAKWKEIGVKINVAKVKSTELQANYFVNKTYDILLYGISLNESSDPYAYWSSSAATSRGLNFSGYKSPASDADLDIARTKINPAERKVRLERFIKRWEEDAPAAALYIPSVKLVYNADSVLPQPNQNVPISNYVDSFEFLTDIKAQKKNLYRTE
ncbi:MAG: peptide/nickel transport system substrate-binding protein [Patescibacteria group bacterium]|nr:peptide/nickel transport system substrate-binding protein [Patescibacteria group bacterium]